ncbi:sensor domain-containing diguanylate cyclase [Lachnotalea glycerini]|uniref:Sensor domain-containing diguanylate cyclase n=1 Tax=Lachnotalea glycerini TaxID=1763509 RepID=A0A371JJU8_9FIRM|nr:sensor domain-containing diguanylate cyclase [Lachnotalea glycerini]RDY32999.1 sensor domain-containing diguanylate cyclase [Lachnotalea glycerini]
MNSSKIIKIHTYIAKIRFIYWVLFVLYYVVRAAVNNCYLGDLFDVISRVLISVLIILDFAYSRKNYNNNFQIIQVIRTPMAMWSSVNVIIHSDRIYVALLSMLFFVALVIQILYLTDIFRFRHKLIMFFIILLPMLIADCVKIIQMSHWSFIIHLILFNLILFTYMLVMITLISHVFAENNLEMKRLRNELFIMKQNVKLDNLDTEKSLENAYERLSHENSEMLVENLIQQYISSSLEISNLMKLISESLSEALVVNLCSIIVKNEYDESYQYNSRAICESIKMEHFNSHIEDGSLIKCFQDFREPFVDNQVDMKRYDFLEGMNIKSLLIYPLVNEENWLGMLVIGKDTNDYFLNNMSFFERVSTQFSIALMNARIYTKMENMAMKDGLTGIFNRTYMIQKINEYISDIVLNKGSLTVILFDIDKFKKVNDTYGHLFGDEVIRVCADAAEEVAEKNHGFAARYGGEEFVIVCKEKSINKLHQLANQLHTKIKETKIKYRGSTLFVDISIGAAAYPTTCDNPAELLDRADKAMYHSKISGRGCITFDGEYE